MKVLCKKLLSPTGEVLSWSPRLTLGKEYTVIEVNIDPDRPIDFRIIADDGTPILCHATQLDVVEGDLPSNWRAKLRDDGVLKLAPESWLHDDFWVDYFDASPEAVSAFELELKRILTEAT